MKQLPECACPAQAPAAAVTTVTTAACQLTAPCPISAILPSQPLALLQPALPHTHLQVPMHSFTLQPAPDSDDIPGQSPLGVSSSEDEGFVVEDNSDDEELGSGSGSGAEQDGNDPSGSGCSRVRELTCSNMVSSALEFSEHSGIQSTCLAELLEKMHALNLWVLAGDVMRNGIPDLLSQLGVLELPA